MRYALVVGTKIGLRGFGIVSAGVSSAFGTDRSSPDTLRRPKRFVT